MGKKDKISSEKKILFSKSDNPSDETDGTTIIDNGINLFRLLHNTKVEIKGAS